MTGPGNQQRDHGGGIDAAAALYGGARSDWLDLSTGINPVAYPIGFIPLGTWQSLPDARAMDRLLAAARAFWDVPDTAQIIAAPGASAIIAQLPGLADGDAFIPTPTYNEHAAAFRAHGRQVTDDSGAPAHVYVHPNNPDGRFWDGGRGTGLTILDESFCDTCPADSQVALTVRPGTVVLKSFGKFWGLGGLRLGFAIGHPQTLAPPGRAGLADLLGPWAVSGPALEIGARALEDTAWATETRQRLREDTTRLDTLMAKSGATLIGGTTLFRTYSVPSASHWQDKLARSHIWTRIFPYSTEWIRLGLPGSPADWTRLEEALQ